MNYPGNINVISMRDGINLDYLFKQHFPVDFHLLYNCKSYKRDTFTVDTIDHGLSFDWIKSTLSSKFF